MVMCVCVVACVHVHGTTDMRRGRKGGGKVREGEEGKGTKGERFKPLVFLILLGDYRKVGRRGAKR